MLSILLCVVDRRAPGPGLGLLRRLARPDPRARHGRDVRVPVVPAGDRVRVPAHRPDRRQRDRGRAVADRRSTCRSTTAWCATPRSAPRRRRTSRRRARSAPSDGVDHAALPVRQRRPERAGHRHAQRRRRDPARWPAWASSASASSPTDAAEWGHDLNRALADAGAGVWWTGLYPGLAIVLLVTGLTLVGEGLNETINPTLRRRRLLPVVMPPRETDGGRIDDGPHRRRPHGRADEPVIRRATCASGTAPRGAPSAPSTASASTSRRARRSAWWASPGCGKSTLGPRPDGAAARGRQARRRGAASRATTSCR